MRCSCKQRQHDKKNKTESIFKQWWIASQLYLHSFRGWSSSDGVNWLLLVSIHVCSSYYYVDFLRTPINQIIESKRLLLIMKTSAYNHVVEASIIKLIFAWRHDGTSNGNSFEILAIDIKLFNRNLDWTLRKFLLKCQKFAKFLNWTLLLNIWIIMKDLQFPFSVKSWFSLFYISVIWSHSICCLNIFGNHNINEEINILPTKYQ